jgi:hypothetical protein
MPNLHSRKWEILKHYDVPKGYVLPQKKLYVCQWRMGEKKRSKTKLRCNITNREMVSAQESISVPSITKS